MSKVLGYTSPFAGHLFPIIGTLLELRARGHKVLMAIGPEGVGLAPTPTAERPRVMPVQSWATRRPGAVLRVTMPQELGGQARADWHERWLFGMPAAQDLRCLIAQERPDCLVLDPMLWGAIVAAEASGLPFAAIAHSSRHIPTLGPRLFGPGVAPASGVVSRWRERLAASAAARLEDATVLPHLNALRAEYRLDPLKHVDEQFYRPSITVACTAEPFEYPRQDWHPSVRFVGPILWEPPGEEPAWANDLDDRPLVLVSSSSVEQAGDRLVELTLEGLAGQHVQVVATVLTGGFPAAVPPNAHVTGYVPHSRLLARAACVVCRAGLGLTQKALAAGVPVVAAPLGSDQFEVARRVDVARAGVLIRPADVTSDRLRDAVGTAMQCRPGAERVAAAFRGAGGSGAAAAAIEEALHRTGSLAPTSPGSTPRRGP